jgi:RimJ/RimL family protein N-acetyltransferase
MTNSLVALIGLASAAGYKSLHALVNPVNNASMKVLERAGFTLFGEIVKDNEPYVKYEMKF